uniref:Uncharacterized protein n=1 Tax=Arundo donax TaxID=35708 RepID=A0A0A9H0C6_ARUDO
MSKMSCMASLRRFSHNRTAASWIDRLSASSSMASTDSSAIFVLLRSLLKSRCSVIWPLMVGPICWLTTLRMEEASMASSFGMAAASSLLCRVGQTGAG